MVGIVLESVNENFAGWIFLDIQILSLHQMKFYVIHN